MRGESLRRGAEGSYETGVQCLYLPLDDTPSLPAGSHPWGWERWVLAAGRRRRRSRRGQRSAGARCTRPPPPPVPLCHEPALTPGTELCGRSVPRKRAAGLLARCIQVYPGSCFHPQSRGSRSSAPTDSSPERRRAAAAVEAKGVGVSPAMPPPQRVHEDGSVSRCLPEELCCQRAACVYRGLGSPQISGAFFTGGRHRS